MVPPTTARPLPALLLALAMASIAMVAAAEPAPQTGKKAPDPLDSNAAVPLVNHVSSLGTGPRSADSPRIAWREANDTVARIGGWRVYLREAQQPDAVPTSKPAHAPAPTRTPAAAGAGAAPPVSTTPPSGHSGHKMP